MALRSQKRKSVLLLSISLITVSLILMLGLISWAWTSNIEESVPGMGQLIPEGNIREVMAPSSGIVAKLYVQKNDVVKVGQVLLEMDPEQTEIESQSYEEQIALLKEESEMLQAAYQGKSPRTLPTSSVQQAWLTATQQTLNSEVAQAEQQIRESEHAMKETEVQIRHNEELLQSMQDAKQRYHKLYEEGGIPKIDVQTFDDKVTKQQGDLSALRETRKSRMAEWEKARRKPAELTGTYQKDLLARLVEQQKTITQLESNQELNHVSMKHLVVRAPVDGVIHEQMIYGPGDVVATMSQKLFSIVPADAPLVAEVKVSNREMSYIRLHQRAELRVEAFPYQHFGRLSGMVSTISPSTVMDPDGKPYYLVRITPEKLWMKDHEGHKNNLRPGMTVTADIVTREKSILSFFSDPVQSQLDSAFRDPTTR